MTVSTIFPNRTCANCACFGRLQPDGTMAARDDEKVPAVCRRFAPVTQRMRMMIPAIDAHGHPITDRSGQQRMTEQVGFSMGYPATKPEAVCFDGWRPEGYLPGQRFADAEYSIPDPASDPAH